MELFLSSGGRTSIQIFKRKQNPSIIYDFETFKYENSPANIKFSGIEIDYEDQVSNLNILSSFSHIYSNNGDLRYIPRNTFKMSSNLKINNKSNLILAMKNNSSSKRLDQKIHIIVSYFILDLKYNHLLDDKKVNLFLWINNLFNKEYFEIENYNTKGRNFKVGLNINI